MCARTTCLLVSSTRNIALGSASVTTPSISMTPSFLAISSANCWLPQPADLHRAWLRTFFDVIWLAPLAAKGRGGADNQQATLRHLAGNVKSSNGSAQHASMHQKA